MRLSPGLRAFLPAVAWAGLVWLSGSLDTTPRVPSTLPLDKVAHFALFGVLGWLLGRGWAATRHPGRGWLIVAALALGGADEVRQSFNPNRSADVADFAADALGVFAGFLFAVRRGTRVPHDLEQ